MLWISLESKRKQITVTTIVRLNVTENTFTKGGLAEFPWIAKEHGKDSWEDTTYLRDGGFKGIWLVRAGDQIEAEVVHVAKNGKFAYVRPTAAAFENGKARLDTDSKAVEVIPASKEDAPVAERPANKYGKYVSSRTLDTSGTTSYGDFVTEILAVRKVFHQSREYYTQAVTTICLSYRTERVLLEKQIAHWKGSLKALQSIGASPSIIKNIEDDLSQAGDQVAKLDWHRNREMKAMVRELLAEEEVVKDFEFALQGQNLMDEKEWQSLAGKSYPFVLWLLDQGVIYNSKAHMRRLLDYIEEITVKAALGSESNSASAS
jgi:hypothetical protein